MSAARRLAFNDRKELTPGTRAASSSVLIKPIVVDEVDSSQIIKRLGQQFLPPGAVLGLQHGQQLLMVELAGIVEVHLHILAEGLVALRHGVVQISHGHDVAHLERFLLLHQKLHHDLQCRAFPLEHARTPQSASPSMPG